ncbi:phosphoglycerate mutase-like protein 4 isoform X3 [Punica granatum]|uniref:Phosphoglycerate mutase-like protein 4 isoform X3 n=1 Tax=Punica granatum TaxID=22663 RepID=A0A6P8CJE1_PUNGR|nr:phosphoglycerate mutase-like protein 4 isoform X3 [Punica granatum]
MSASDHRETCRSDGNGNAEIGSVEADYAEIVVVRHGETEWNSDSRIQGHLDVELNQAGKQQAAAVADRLSREGKINSVYSSDLKRAFETAQAIVTACGGLEGGGESIDQLYQRCTSSLQNIARKHKGERVVVVTHGGVIRSLYQRACPSRRFGKVLNTSVNIFHLSDGGNKWVLRSSGDVSHLDRAGFLETGFGGDIKSG